MQLSKSVEYAIKSLLFLHRANKPTSLKEISSSEKIPKPYLAKIMRKLVEKGFLKSCNGRNGGYTMEIEIKSISLWDIVNLFEKDKKLLSCLSNPSVCKDYPSCYQKVIWQRLQYEIIKSFKKIKLNEMVIKRKGL